jgi:hypothetical protein
MMEAFYKMATDRVDQVVNQINSLLLMIRHFQEYPKEFYLLPQTEQKRLRLAMTTLQRRTFLTCRLYRPQSPLSLTPTGYGENVSQGLWDAGVCIVQSVIQQETGNGGAIRTFNV